MYTFHCFLSLFFLCSFLLCHTYMLWHFHFHLSLFADFHFRHMSILLYNGNPLGILYTDWFFGLRSHPWKSVILNDLNPLRTNFLNVIKTEPLKLIKQILESDLLFIEQPETKNPKLSAYKKAINDNAKKRAKYHKVDCNIDIAYQMFIVQCINKAMVESAGKIMERIFRFLPAHLKLQNAVITQQDCLNN